jgi:hypothetical protein
MKNLFCIDYQAYNKSNILTKLVVTKEFMTKELSYTLETGGITEEEKNLILDKIFSFYKYNIYNDEITKEIISLFFNRIISGDFKINTYNENNANCIAFICKKYIHLNTLSLFRNKVITLKEIKKLHNIFSNYGKGIDYEVIDEYVCFEKYKDAKAVTHLMGRKILTDYRYNGFNIANISSDNLFLYHPNNIEPIKIPQRK